MRDNDQEIGGLLDLDGVSDLGDEGLDESEHLIVLFRESCGQEIAHMDNDTLLRSHVVLETILATSSLLDFITEGKSIEVKQLEHFLALCLLLCDSEESRLEAVREDESHSAESGTLDTEAASNEILTEDRACECDVAEDLTVHHVGLISLVTGEVKDDLGRGLDISDDTLIGKHGIL